MNGIDDVVAAFSGWASAPGTWTSSAAELRCSKVSAARMRERHRRPVGRACALVFQGPDCVVRGRQGWTEEWRAVD